LQREKEGYRQGRQYAATTGIMEGDDLRRRSLNGRRTMTPRRRGARAPRRRASARGSARGCCAVRCCWRQDWTSLVGYGRVGHPRLRDATRRDAMRASARWGASRVRGAGERLRLCEWWRGGADIFQAKTWRSILCARPAGRPPASSVAVSFAAYTVLLYLRMYGRGLSTAFAIAAAAASASPRTRWCTVRSYGLTGTAPWTLAS
jgi:hypothetical protein